MESEIKATFEFRWLLSPTPGERPTLQQKWIGIPDGDTGYTIEEWRDVPEFFDRNW